MDVDTEALAGRDAEGSAVRVTELEGEAARLLLVLELNEVDALIPGQYPVV